MAKIIHICKDEKFINSAYDQFEEICPNENVFYIYGSDSKDTQHIKLNSAFRFFDPTPEFFSAINDSIIVFHSLPNPIIPFLEYLNKSNKVVWFLFGFETYGDPLLYSEDQLLDQLTYKNYRRKTIKYSFRDRLKNLLFPIIRKVKKELYLSKAELIHHKRNQKLSDLKRADYIATSFEEEKEEQSKILQFDRPFFNFWYYPIDKIVNVNQVINSEKNSIIIGNSGYPNGNHLDVVWKLKDYDLKNAKILMPFSYGDANYINDVKPKIQELKNEIVFLEDFMPLDDYNKILTQTKVAIFNNRRQQAVGNIIALLYWGAKVFLSEKNSFYNYLKRHNLIIFSYENELDSVSIANALTIEDQDYNRNILLDLFSTNRNRQELQSSIAIIKNDLQL